MGVLGVDIEDPSCSAKALVPASKIDGANAVLAQHRGAHDAGLDGDIEVRLVEDGDGVLGQDAGNGDKLGVPGAVEGAVCFVHAAANDVAVPDKDTADGSFVAFEGELGHSNGLAHEALMIRPLVGVHGVWSVSRFVVLARSGGHGSGSGSGSEGVVCRLLGVQMAAAAVEGQAKAGRGQGDGGPRLPRPQHGRREGEAAATMGHVLRRKAPCCCCCCCCR